MRACLTADSADAIVDRRAAIWIPRSVGARFEGFDLPADRLELSRREVAAIHERLLLVQGQLLILHLPRDDALLRFEVADLAALDRSRRRRQPLRFVVARLRRVGILLDPDARNGRDQLPLSHRSVFGERQRREQAVAGRHDLLCAAAGLELSLARNPVRDRAEHAPPDARHQQGDDRPPRNPLLRRRDLHQDVEPLGRRELVERGLSEERICHRPPTTRLSAQAALLRSGRRDAGRALGDRHAIFLD